MLLPFNFSAFLLSILFSAEICLANKNLPLAIFMQNLESEQCVCNVLTTFANLNIYILIIDQFKISGFKNPQTPVQNHTKFLILIYFKFLMRARCWWRQKLLVPSWQGIYQGNNVYNIFTSGKGQFYIKSLLSYRKATNALEAKLRVVNIWWHAAWVDLTRLSRANIFYFIVIMIIIKVNNDNNIISAIFYHIWYLMACSLSRFNQVIP